VTERNWASGLRALFLKHEWLRGYALLSPTLMVMICALALPIFTLIVYSFWTQDYVQFDKTATLKNYETFFDRSMYGGLLLRSIRMSATVTVITILLAYPVAYFLAFKVRKNIMTWLILINLPFWTSYLLRVLAWKIMLGNNGVINSTLLELDIIQGPRVGGIRDPADLPVALEDRPLPVGGCGGPRRKSCSNFSASHFTAVDAGCNRCSCY
jgi:spermidine/putrescine transport system permease protein